MLPMVLDAQLVLDSTCVFFLCFQHPFERQQSLESNGQRQSKQLKHCNPAKALRIIEKQTVATPESES